MSRLVYLEVVRASLISRQPCQSLFVAPCSHVWHYKCIRPIINDIKNYPQFMCPNCRAVTDLEADVDDPADDEWDEGHDEELSPELNPAGATNGVAPDFGEQVMNGNDEGLSHSTSRLLSINDHAHTIPQRAISAEATSGPSITSGLLNRRGASHISPSSTPAQDHSATNLPSAQIQYLRPITPTQPLLENEDLNESSMRRPTMTDHFTQDGPMTPTNNAGPFVFDGSAGRIVGRTEVGSMPETGTTSSEA